MILCSLISSAIRIRESDLVHMTLRSEMGRGLICLLWCVPVLFEVPSSSPSSASARSESTGPESWEMLIAVICWVTGLGELGLTLQWQQKLQFIYLRNKKIFLIQKLNSELRLWDRFVSLCLTNIPNISLNLNTLIPIQNDLQATYVKMQWTQSKQ